MEATCFLENFYHHDNFSFSKQKCVHVGTCMYMQCAGACGTELGHQEP